jgi:hypothetical protein
MRLFLFADATAMLLATFSSLPSFTSLFFSAFLWPPNDEKNEHKAR